MHLIFKGFLEYVKQNDHLMFVYSLTVFILEQYKPVAVCQTNIENELGSLYRYNILTTDMSTVEN